MNVLQMQFLDLSVRIYRCNFLILQCEQGRAGESKEAGDEAEEGDGFEGEVCYSITHKVQFNVNCQIIS